MREKKLLSCNCFFYPAGKRQRGLNETAILISSFHSLHFAEENVRGA